MAISDPSARTLEFTPTWAVAAVCALFVVISLGIVKIIEKVESGFREGKKKALLLALRKMKEELMLLGFISLLLTVSQTYVASICVQSSLLEHFTPCNLSDRKTYGGPDKGTDSPSSDPSKKGDAHRRLMGYLGNSLLEEAAKLPIRRQLAGGGGGLATTCPEGKESFVSATGLGQLHIFIFVLAVVHVVYSLVAMGLASLKVRTWKTWEDEAQQNSHDRMLEMVRTLTVKRQSTFVAYHSTSSSNWSHDGINVWVVCFFRQFGISVTRADYLTLRLGFIKNHNTGSKFDFYSYMVRCMEDEFQEIVGISAWLWAFVVAYMLFNVSGTKFYFWVCFLPVVMVLVVGAKLQHIIATLAIESAMATNPRSAIKPRDELFWFSNPRILLKLIHFVLFQNAFELATFLWYWSVNPDSVQLQHAASIRPCNSEQCKSNVLSTYLDHFQYSRSLGQRLVTEILNKSFVWQMGSEYKHSIFQDNVKEKLNIWRKDAKKKAKLANMPENSKAPSPGDNVFHDRSADGSTTTEFEEGPFHDIRSGAVAARDEQ
ncbi:hypothetical protein R1flu_005659 [Riccia fluitans]|uniref:MLO-like protein n=1 Tax=Riccia fluitans TaxID=41844 RepID=A0ABD1YUM0_9MARC